ncbi:MAG: DNA polymerase IV [Planctomycetota bacterium]
MNAPYDERLGILHADMDAFYAAVECLDDPSLCGQPLIIGHPGRRGVVSTASYEARRYGVHSAMPSVEALRLCPVGVWRSPRMGRYTELSQQIREIFGRYTPLVEPISVDEAFLDVFGSLRLFGGALAIATQLQQTVEDETGGLTVSIGVAPNKFLAKLASDLDKPRGISVIDPDRVEEQLAPLPIRRLWGVGKKSEARLHALGLTTIGDVVRFGEESLVRQLGDVHGRHLFALARGRDTRRVQVEHTAKSISTESTFAHDLRELDQIDRFLFGAAESVAESLRKSGFVARTVQLKVRSGSFHTYTRASTLDSPTDLPQVLYEEGRRLFDEKIDLRGEGIRLLGLGAKGLLSSDTLLQGDLFQPPESTDSRAADVSDQIRKKLGRSAITRARLLGDSRQDSDEEPQ